MLIQDDRAYIDHINGRWEASVYAGDGSYQIARSSDRADLVAYCERHGYRVIDISEGV